MNINCGLMPPVAVPRGRRKERAEARKRAMTARALADLDAWLDGRREAAEWKFSRIGA
jgi:methylenetetrahydrofolate--tRNA-(uracil-5-)-methyltransferase